MNRDTTISLAPLSKYFGFSLAANITGGSSLPSEPVITEFSSFSIATSPSTVSQILGGQTFEVASREWNPGNFDPRKA